MGYTSSGGQAVGTLLALEDAPSGAAPLRPAPLPIRLPLPRPRRGAEIGRQVSRQVGELIAELQQVQRPLTTALHEDDLEACQYITLSSIRVILLDLA